MPATILSRCQRFDFKRIGAEDMSERLLYIAEQENISMTVEAANLISRLADGAMRDALSIMDQCIAAGKDITTKLVSEVCGIAGREYLAETAGALLKRDTAKLLQIVSNLHENACDMERYCSELINFFRNIMVARTVKQPEKLMICSDEELQSICRFSESFTLPAAIAVIDTLQKTYAEIKAGVQGRTAMEMALIRLASPELDARDESVLKRLAQVEKELKTGVKVQATEEPATPAAPGINEELAAPTASAEPEAPQQPEETPPPAEQAAAPEQAAEEAAPAEKEAPQASAPAQNAAVPIRQWPEILQELFPKNRLVWTILNGTNAKQVGNTIVVYGTHPSIPDVLAVKVNADDVLEAANAVTLLEFTKVISQRDAEELLGESRSEAVEDPLQAFIDKAQQGGITIDYK